MTGIQTLTSSYYGGAAATAHGAWDKSAPTAMFDETLSSVSAAREDAVSEPAYDNHDDDDNAAHDETETSDETRAGTDSADASSSRANQHTDAVALSIPFEPVHTGKATAVKTGVAEFATDPTQAGKAKLAANTASATAKLPAESASDSTILRAGLPAGFKFEAAADMDAPGARLTLDAKVSQVHAPIAFRPGAALSNGLTTEATEQIVALREGAQNAARRKFAAGETALERLAERKAASGDNTANNGDACGRTRTTFAERMANLADRLSEHVPGPETAPRQTRPIAVALPANANSAQAAQPSTRAGDLPFTQSLTDTTDNAAQLAAQAANRAIQSAPSTAQLGARAPQAPAGTPTEQVSVQIQHGLRNDGDRINVRLYPAALGKVEVKLELGPDKTVQAIVTAEKPETLDMLARDARILQRALEDAGLQTNSNSLSFQQGDDTGNGGSFAEHTHGAPSSFDGSGSDNDMSIETMSEVDQSPRRAVHDGVLDVEI